MIKKKRLMHPKVFPHPTVRAPSASSSLSVLSPREGSVLLEGKQTIDVKNAKHFKILQREKCERVKFLNGKNA